MNSASYIERRGQLETYFDRTAADAWAKLTSDAPVSGVRATVRAGRDAMRATAFAKFDFEEKFDGNLLSKMGNHTVSLLLDENEFTRSTITTEPLVMGNNADFHLSTDANIFQREGSAIFYISDPFLNAFDDPSFQLSDFHTTGLQGNANVQRPEKH